MCPRHSQFRRYVYWLTIFTMFFYLFARVHRYSPKSFLNHSGLLQSPLQYSEYIDPNGNFLAYSGYKILQLIKGPIPPDLADLNTYLTQQNELKLYFQFVPIKAFHITLTSLTSAIPYRDDQVEVLKKEQDLLDTYDTETACMGKQLLIIDRNEIRLEIDITNEYFHDHLKVYQNRWNEKFPELITAHHASFYVTLAYQYRQIPSQEIFNQLDEILKRWQLFPIFLQLDPIEICSFNDLITYTAITNDDFIFEQ